MHQIEIVYKGDLRTEALHLKSGEKIITDAPVDNQGKGEAFSPTDLTAAALGSCMLTIMGITAKSRHININGTHATIEKKMGTSPRRIAEINLHLHFPNTHSEAEQELLQKSAHSCPVHHSLHPEIKINTQFHFSKT